jgi:DNA-binding MarR family transcriptional regulator
LSQAARETMTRIQLAQSVGLSASGVTRLIAPMEKLGLVEKDSHPRDARISLVKLSKAGRRICEETSTTVSETARAMFESLTEAQRGAIGNLLLKLF